MKNFFKWFFITFTFFLLLLFGVAGVLSDTYTVERTINIHAPKDSVFSFVANIKTWEKWYPWFLVDSLKQSDVHATPEYVGSYWKWNGNLIGKGELIFTDVAPTDSIAADMKFKEPKASVVKEYWYFKTNGDSTAVTWKHVGNLDYPMGRILGLWSDKMLGATFEEGLKNLKSELERKD
jgi:hypothetical protein